MRADGSWPSMLGKHQVGPHLILQLPESALSYTILEVSIHTTEGDGLAALDNLLHEQILGKSAIVSMIMEDFYSM
jgi:hypothetical protein